MAQFTSSPAGMSGSAANHYLISGGHPFMVNKIPKHSMQVLTLYHVIQDKVIYQPWDSFLA